MKFVFQKTLKALGKIAVSGVIAFAILTIYCFFYYNLPARNASTDGSTDYKYEANTFHSRGTEGFAWGKTNNEGFTNLFDYNDNMSVDILVMGSSHMEAYNVDVSQCTASILNALLENEIVYNIGVSEHFFLTCASNLRAALTKYHPTKYVVIETDCISFSNEAIALAINENTEKIPAYDGGLIALLQRNPYLRLIHKQITHYLQSRDIDESPENFSEADTTSNEELLSNLLLKMSALAGEYGAKIIIVYHPGIDIAQDGTIELNTDQEAITHFSRSCEANGILFLDMGNRFKKEYESEYVLPYGFFNSPVGQGHLNQYGHAMMADELYDLILEDAQ